MGAAAVVLDHVDSSFVHASRTDVRYCSSLAKRRDDDDDDDVVNFIDDGDTTFHSISFGGRGGVSPPPFWPFVDDVPADVNDATGTQHGLRLDGLLEFNTVKNIATAATFALITEFGDLVR